MVFTVEPGIYIPEGSQCLKKWWNIGVRIEDDILINEIGPATNLSGKLPRTVTAIEALMQEDSYLKY
jgi:Xaa-Pro aminopeptidase